MRIPSYTIYYFSTGTRQTEEYGDLLECHSIDGPAKIHYYQSGEKQYELYAINNLRHRTDGPACIWYFKNGTIRVKEFWIEGEHLPDFENYYSSNMSAKTLFEYLKIHPNYIKEIIILARSNNWLTDETQLLFDTINLFSRKQS